MLSETSFRDGEMSAAELGGTDVHGSQGRNHVEKSSLESSGAPVAEGTAYLKGRL